MTKSFILKTPQPKGSTNVDSLRDAGLHGMHFILNNNCSEHCSLTISEIQFASSLIEFNNMDIWIDSSGFNDSFITAGAQEENPKNGFNLTIRDCKFNNTIPVEYDSETTMFNNESCMQLTYVCLSGNWNSVIILKSQLDGDGKSEVSAVEVMHANIQALSVINVRISLVTSALIVRSSGVGLFNVSDSIFIGNRDGINIGHGVRYLLVSRSVMNHTGSWSGGGAAFEQCSSALKASVQRLKVRESVFAHNQAYGMTCKGAALYIKSNINVNPLLSLSHEKLERGAQLSATIEIQKSVFYENVVENCSVGNDLDNLGGGAITVYGAQLLTKIVESTFARNKACKGAGIYIGISERWGMGYSQNRSVGQVLSSGIIVETCTFHENIAGFGGGLMTEFTESTLDSGGNLSTLIYNSAFHRNNATLTGAGILLHYLNATMNNRVTVTIQFSKTDFMENVVTGKYPHGHGGGIFVQFSVLSLMSSASIKIVADDCSFKANKAGAGELICNHSISRCYFKKVFGGGMYLNLKSLFLLSSASLKTVVNNCSFTLNSAEFGAGIAARIESSSIDYNSSFRIQIVSCIFTSQTARWDGAGIMTEVSSCLCSSNSTIIFHTTASTFISNAASSGAGIHTSVESCSIDLDSSLMLKMTDSLYAYNTVENHGTGIYTSINSCSISSNSLLTLHILQSIYSFNTAGFYGAGLTTYVGACSVYSASSFVIGIIDSTFISNTARHGAGIYTWVAKSSISPHSLFILQTSNSTFKSNTVKLDGAGSYIDMHACSIHLHSSFHIQYMDCRFQSNVGDRGAGLFLLHSPEDSCASGDVSVVINDCTFLNNTAAREGGSLYFQVFLITQLYVKQSLFETNQASTGSGLFRESIDFQKCEKTCDSLTFGQKTQQLTPTQIIECKFVNNIDTAIHVKSKQKYGTVKIMKCLFRNNICINSSFAEDVFTKTDLEIKDTNILKESNHRRVTGINSQSDTKLQNVTVNSDGLSFQRQISIAILSHYITQANRSSLEYQCPVFYQPVLSTAGLSDTGAVMVRATCDACFEGYYTGQTWLAISVENHLNYYHCNEKEIKDKWGRTLGTNRLCYTNSTGQCVECPQGANCSAGVMALPNYWGHMAAHDRLEFHRCPVGYCCNQAPCEGIAKCAAHREGILCGHCMKGFTESLITPECIPDQTCGDWWIFPLFCFWTLTVTLIMIFGQDILQTRDKFEMCLKRNKSLKQCEDKISTDGTNVKELRHIDNKEVNKPKNTTSRGKSTESMSKRRHSIEIKPILHTVSSSNTSRMKPDYILSKKTNISACLVKIPILWGLLTIHRGQNVEVSGKHKYLQIMLYYLQDAAIMQVDLALASTIVTPIQKLRQLLLNISQLAVDLIDLGLNLCPIPGWTPVSRLLMKNLTGPFVILYIIAIYGSVRVASKCFPSKRNSLRTYWYPRLTAATIFSTLLFDQQIANVAFSLLYCIKTGDQAVLFIDGTVTCYQPWQILVFIFAFNWVIGIIPVLMFLPGLLDLGLIKVSHFFLACLMPIPMLVYWLHRFYRKKLRALIYKNKVNPWHEEALRILQKTFVKTTDRKGLPICWVGFMKVRRLALVLLFTFVNNLVARISLMSLIIVLFLLFHLETKPYQDDLANKLYTVSLLATLAIGFINIMKAACVEFYLDLEKVAHFLTVLNMITDGILVYCPLGLVGLSLVITVIGKVKQIVQNRKNKQN